MKLIILKMSRRDRREDVAIYTALNPISVPSEFLHFPAWFRGGAVNEIVVLALHCRNKLIHLLTHRRMNTNTNID